MTVTNRLRDLAERYTAAWSSQEAARVASCYSPHGSLTVNDGSPAVGRIAIAAVAQEFMTALPGMKLFMDGLSEQAGRIVYRWTLEGAKTGPGGTGKPIRISGHEEWRIGADGLIAESRGHFDNAEYQRQLQQGFEETR